MRGWLGEGSDASGREKIGGIVIAEDVVNIGGMMSCGTRRLCTGGGGTGDEREEG